ncbi:MAG: hypothetical protein HYX95_03485 [Chloroflexi bacterium]|nr:hypothetical protein [Chloroflexota bacterium]
MQGVEPAAFEAALAWGRTDPASFRRAVGRGERDTPEGATGILVRLKAITERAWYEEDIKRVRDSMRGEGRA